MCIQLTLIPCSKIYPQLVVQHYLHVPRFVNVGFTVMSGAALVFDMPKTKLGPNANVSLSREWRNSVLS